MLQVRRLGGRHPIHLAKHPLLGGQGGPVQRELLRHEARAHRAHHLRADLDRPERRARVQDVQALRATHRIEDGRLLPRLPAAGAVAAAAHQPARPSDLYSQCLLLHPRARLPAPRFDPARLHREGEWRRQDHGPLEGSDSVRAPAELEPAI